METENRRTGLCLKRRLNESTLLFTSDGIIEIKVVEITKGKLPDGSRSTGTTSLKFSSPKNVQILRSEKYTGEIPDA